MKRPKFTIFLKLIIIFVVSLIVLDIAVLFAWRIGSDTKPRKLFPLYLRKIEQLTVEQIGSPPDTIKAKKICEELDWNIRYQSHDLNWATTPGVPALEDLSKSPEFKEHFPNEDQFQMPFNERPYSVIKDSKGVFIIEPINPREFFSLERALFSVLIVISIIIVVLYFVLRLMFKPLKTLSTAVETIAGGDYDVNLPVNRKDELGELADSINYMSSRIKESIKAKEHLLLDVSHELRSPLTRIKLGLEVGSNKEKINEDIKEMEHMISGLLESYRAGSEFDNLNFEKTDIVNLLKNVIREYNSDERLWLDLPEKGAPVINIDSGKIRTVFRNLIDNALKYSNDKVEIKLADKKDNVEISFVDKGIGISDEDIKYVFEQFYRADPSRSRKTGGFGLGLSISKKIIDAHGGKISVESKLNEGTKIIINLKKV
jgi:signal transduction histidine kinase